MTRPAPAATPADSPVAPAPNFALTNEEAITRFEELSRLVQSSYSNHDASLLSHIYTPSSPLRPIAEEELNRLANDGVRDLSEFRTIQLLITERTPNQIRFKEVVIVTPRFESDSGEDLTKDVTPIRQDVRWTLQLHGNEWLLHDALITKAKALS